MVQRVELMPSLSQHLKEESVHAREYRLTSLGIVTSCRIKILYSTTDTHDCFSEFTALGISLHSLTNLKKYSGNFWR